jgi:hypothetical protein
MSGICREITTSPSRSEGWCACLVAITPSLVIPVRDRMGVGPDRRAAHAGSAWLTSSHDRRGPCDTQGERQKGTSSTHSWQSPGHATWCTAFYLAPMRRRRELDPPGGERSRRRWRPRCFWPGSRFRASTAVCTHPRDVAEERRCSARHRRLGCEYRFVAPPDSLTEWAAIWRAGRRTYDASPRGPRRRGLSHARPRREPPPALRRCDQ